MAQSFRSNLSNVAVKYIQQLKLPFTKSAVRNKLEHNPFYPSLYSISNVFSRLNIDNQAFEIHAAELDQFEAPFIAYLNIPDNGKDFVLVTKITDTAIHYIADGNKAIKVSKRYFLKEFKNIVFVAEGNAQSGEQGFNENLQKEKRAQYKKAALFGGAIALLGLVIFQFFYTLSSDVVGPVILIITKLLGLTITVLLLVYEVDKTNSFVKNICTAGKQTNCDAVLNSKAGKILGMSWAEVGFFYFASTTMFFLFPGTAFANKLPWLAIAGTAVAPYIVFSVYYQWKVVQQWCPLCLAIQAVLFIEACWSIYSIFSGDGFTSPLSIGEICHGAFCMLLPIVLWYILKPIIHAANAAPGYYAAYKRLLYNPDTFNSLLQQQDIAPEVNGLGISIGNPNAKNTIIKVCNPYCGPCAKAHPILEEIIKHNPDINIRVIFTATNNENDRAAKVVKHLLAIQATNNLHQTEKALNDWYKADKKDYESFAAKYPMNGELKLQEDKIDAMSNWCNSAEITHTPTIFINGKRLPDTYSIDDLKNIL